MGTLDDFQGRPYKWPHAYCGAVIHAMLRDELGVRSEYPLLELEGFTEARMVKQAITEHGSIGAAHDDALMKVHGVKRVTAHRVERSRLLWCPSGYVQYNIHEHSPELTDRSGAMLMRDRITLPFQVWTPEGLRCCHPRGIGPEHRGWTW